MRRGAHGFRRAGWLALVACLCASDADARDSLSYWIDLVGGWNTDKGRVLLDPSETIELTFIVLNSEDSQAPVVLGDGFFRRLRIEVIEPETGEVVATLSRWHDFGSCAGVLLTCPLDLSMTLAPGESAGFRAVLSTTDGKPLELGMWATRITVGEARQRVLALDGSPWSGWVGEGGTTPLELREIRTADDALVLESQQLAAALDRGDHEEALRIYERRIARDPSDAGAHGSAGTVLANLGRLTEAAASYERALALGSESPVLTDLMAIVYFALGDDSRASAMVRRERSEADAQRREKELRQLAARLGPR